MAALTGAAGAIAWKNFVTYPDWRVMLLAGALGLAGVGLAQRSLAGQVLSRGMAWIVFLPTLVVTVAQMIGGSLPDAAAALLALASGGALFLAHPMLGTKEARREFAPRVFRRWFLAGATASSATAFCTGAIAIDSFSRHPGIAAGFGALTLALFGSAIGIVRMRAWGVLLAGVTSLALLVAALFQREVEASFALALAALPALGFAILPVLLARLADTPAAARRRVDDGAIELPRYRVATDDDSFESDLPLEVERRAATLPAMR